jgi:hypothetical protein
VIEVIEDHSRSPLRLYDGTELDDPGLVCHTGEGTFSPLRGLSFEWRKAFGDHVLTDLSRRLRFGVKFFDARDYACVFIEDAPCGVFLAEISGSKSCWACFSYFEKQPARYQVWLIAVVRIDSKRSRPVA